MHAVRDINACCSGDKNMLFKRLMHDVRDINACCSGDECVLFGRLALNINTNKTLIGMGKMIKVAEREKVSDVRDKTRSVFNIIL